MAGAKYIVSPAFNQETAIICNRYGIPYIPGCMTIKEIITAMEYGCEIIKLFPGSAFGPNYINAIKGPLPYVSLMVTGGVNLNNAAEWFKIQNKNTFCGYLTLCVIKLINCRNKRFLQLIKY